MNVPLIAGIVVFVIVVDVVVVAVIVRLKKKQAQGPSEHFKQLAESLGLEIIGGEPLVPSVKFLSFLTKPYRVKGERNACALEIYSYTERSGENSTTYTTCRIVTPNPRQLTFYFAREGAMARIGKMLGMSDIPTGDSVFDEMFIVKCNDEDFIRRAMIDTVKQQFYAVWQEHSAKGNIRLDKNKFAYTETGRITSDQDSRRFSAAAELMCSLGGIVQFYNKDA